MRQRTPSAVFVLALALAVWQAAAAHAFDRDRAGFSVRFRGEINPHSVLGVFVLPGESLPISVMAADVAAGPYEMQATAGRLEATGKGAWRWQAPNVKGHVPLKIVQQPSGRTMILNAFVMLPHSPAEQAVNGYRLGSYPAKPLRGLPLYLPPQGFVEVTAENRDVLIAPHFTLGQFICKQGSGFPKYVALRERLMLKLERVLEGVNGAGFEVDTFFVMSGYRTPAYNQAINNGQYSRHIYGDAADIFVDRDGDGWMDDLNHNGKSDLGDAIVLRDLVENLYKEPSFRESFTGGLGLYNSTHAHGPYVHVDTRGFMARWTS